MSNSFTLQSGGGKFTRQSGGGSLLLQDDSTFSKVQTGVSATATSGTTVAASLGSNVTQGNLVCVSVLFYDAGTTPPTLSVQDENGKTYTVEPHDSGATNMSTCGWCAQAYLANAPAGAGKTVTATFNRTISLAAIWVDEFHPSSGVTVYDNGAVASGSGAVTTPSIPVAGGLELVYGLAANITVTNGVTGAWTANQGSVQMGTTSEWILAVSAATAVGYAGDGGAYNAVGMSFRISAAQAYTLSVGQGSFALTGETVALKAARLLAAAQSSFTLTGEAVALSRGRSLPVGQGAFALTGEPVGLLASRKLTATQASFTLTGETASLKAGNSLSIVQGLFTLTGESTSFAVSKKVTIGQGSFVLTGEALALLRGRNVPIGQGSFTLTGEPIGLLFAHKMAAVQASFVLTGENVSLIKQANGTMAVGAGSFTVTREPAGLLFGRRLPAVFESFALVGNAASLERARISSMQFGSFSMTGFPVDFRKGQTAFDTMTVDHRSEIDLRTSTASSLQLSHSDSRAIDSGADLRISSASLRLSRSDSRDISL